MANSIHSPDWWQPFLPQLRREFSELTMDILIAGGDAGAGSIRAGSVSVDWDVFNEDALTWLDMYLGGAAVPGLTQEGAYAWAWALNESTRRSVAREIDRWVRNGAPLDELEQRLGLYFDDRRARRIAATEVTRIYASGNVMAWKASGVVGGKRWRAAVDEMACPICSRLHGTFVELDRGWEFSAAMLEASPALKAALRVPMTLVVPPAHVNCRCYLQPVVLEALSEEERAAGSFAPGDASRGAAVPRPAGTPVSAALEIPRRGVHRRLVEHVAGLIDRVHGDGNLPALRITGRKLKPGHFGSYRYGGKPSIEITTSPTASGRHLSLTAVHEIGHFLDHMGVPSRTEMATRDREATRIWREAVQDSRAVRKLADQYVNEHLYGVALDGFTHYPNRWYIDYLLRPEEVWARSYSQYIAVRSGDADLMAAIAADRDDPLYGSKQWDDDDFAPIAAAFDKLFEVLGWLRR